MKRSDVCFDCDGVRFNFRVSCIISSEGKYLLHRKKGDSFWNLIGGRTSLGESSIDAVRREIQEELGCDCVIDALAHVSENFFSFKGTDFHEILMIFRVELKEPIREEDLEQDIEVKWFSGEELEQIDIRPQYTKEIIQKPERITQWIVNDERK